VCVHSLFSSGGGRESNRCDQLLQAPAASTSPPGRFPLEQWPAFDGHFDHTQQQDKKLRQGILMTVTLPSIVELMFLQTKPSLIIKNTKHGERCVEEGSVRAIVGKEMEERPLGKKEFPGSSPEKSEIMEYMSQVGRVCQTGHKWNKGLLGTCGGFQAWDMVGNSSQRSTTWSKSWAELCMGLGYSGGGCDKGEADGNRHALSWPTPKSKWLLGAFLRLLVVGPAPPHTLSLGTLHAEGPGLHTLGKAHPLCRTLSNLLRTLVCIVFTSWRAMCVFVGTHNEIVPERNCLLICLSSWLSPDH
jgi:hypothetical protein